MGSISWLPVSCMITCFTGPKTSFDSVVKYFLLKVPLSRQASSVYSGAVHQHPHNFKAVPRAAPRFTAADSRCARISKLSIAAHGDSE